MPEKKPRNSNNKSWLFYIIIFLVPVVAIFLVYLSFTTYRTKSIYKFVKFNQRGWIGKVHRADKELGFAPIPNSIGSEIMPLGPNLPMRYDKDGFRVPIEDELNNENKHPVVLTLGCSYTYGSLVHAKDTFPYLVGKYIGGSTKNAGCCGYGLSQMVIIAKQLIPRHQPDYVIIQYSTWLVGRAVHPFGASYFGKVPVPYYSKEDILVIKPPVFLTKLSDLPVDEYRNSQHGVSDFLSFLLHVGLPLFLHDDFNISVYSLSRNFGLKDEPTTNARAVIQHAYAEISSVAKQNGAMIIIVVLGRSNRNVLVPKDLLPNDAIVVDAHGELLRKLPTKDMRSYQMQYKHWRGNPPILIDDHPNKKAHKIIAEKIASQIAKLSNKVN